MVRIKIHKICEDAENTNNGFYIADINFDFGTRHTSDKVCEMSLQTFVCNIIKKLETEPNLKSAKSKITFTRPGIDSIENYEGLSGFSFTKAGLSEEEKERFKSIFLAEKNKLTAK